MRKFYTAEAVTEGHPDKLCDQIADAILDVCLKNDENSRVACEVLATKGNIIVAGEITSAYEPDVFAVVRKVLSDIGYSSEGIAMDTFVHQQSPDIAGAVHTSKERREGVSDNQMDWFQGAGDQGVMIGYACDETKQLMPMPVVLANRIVRELSACRQSSYIQGILPDGYTLAEYARRGFFEMAWLSFINLGLMCLAMGLVEKKAGAPALTRGLCLFLGLAALFLIAAASAKMLLYISGYGLTRKRVLTEVFMLWLGVTTILVSVWLFKPRFPYMKGAVICALILGCVTFWADVDTQVARYNVRAYQSGQLETIDMGHMSSLGDGALPYIKGLTHDRDPEIASTAMDILENSYCSISDFRSWTYTESAARKAVDAD